jgi:hypothetical protein
MFSYYHNALFDTFELSNIRLKAQQITNKNLNIPNKNVNLRNKKSQKLLKSKKNNKK